MKLGLFTPVFAGLTFDGLLEELQRYPQISTVELGCGGWPGSHHIDVDALLADKKAAHSYRARIADAGLSISALSCHGNPLHPKEELARRDQETFHRTLLLADRLEVPVVVNFSGCPGGGPNDQTPNWITTGWPPEYVESLAWQWEKVLVPYWKSMEELARSLGIRVALEAHPGFCVYNTETLLQLRAATGPNLGINLDPSHLWWQGMDVPTVIAQLGDAIFHVHAKDVALNPQNTAINGVLDAKSYSAMRQRSWLFRSVGWGHSEIEWKQIAAALRLVGYDYVMSIEHEDALASVHEGLSSAIGMLSRVLLSEPAVDPWWT